MKFRKECSFCKEVYDSLLQECPSCHEPNNDIDVLTTKEHSVYPWWKQLLFFIVGFLGFQIVGLVISLVVLFFVDSKTALYSAIVNFSSYALLFMGLVAISIPKFDELFKSFKRYQPYIAGLVGFIAIMAFNYTYSITLNLCGINLNDNANESSVSSIVTLYPILSILIFGFVGPICEELTYRVGLFTLSRRLSRWAAYLISLTVFAFIHFDWLCFFNGTVVNELLNMPLYLFAGFTFAFIYDRFGLAGSLTAHVLNNVVSISLTLLADKLGI